MFAWHIVFAHRCKIFWSFVKVFLFFAHVKSLYFLLFNAHISTLFYSSTSGILLLLLFYMVFEFLAYLFKHLTILLIFLCRESSFFMCDIPYFLKSGIRNAVIEIIKTPPQMHKFCRGTLEQGVLLFNKNIEPQHQLQAASIGNNCLLQEITDGGSFLRAGSEVVH